MVKLGIRLNRLVGVANDGPVFRSGLGLNVDDYSAIAIDIHKSIQIKPILENDQLKDAWLLHSINLIDIETFVISDDPIKLWFLYIFPSSNPPF